MESEKERLQKKLSGYIGDLQSQKDSFLQGVQTYKKVIAEKYEVSVETMQKVKTGVLVLGGFYVTYKLVSWMLSGGGGEEEEEKSGGPQIVLMSPPEPSIVAQIRNSILLFLLGIAQRELQKVIQKWVDEMKTVEEK